MMWGRQREKGDLQRFPRQVYGHGEDPDPRFSLANERTFLAWIRTTLALLAAGVALEAVEEGGIFRRVWDSIRLFFYGLFN